MSQSVNFLRGFSGLSINKTALKSISVESWTVTDEITVADGTNNQLIAGLTIDFSQLVALFIIATKVMLIETNDSGTPDDSFSTVADLPYEWMTGDYNACLITQDATAVYVTNASGASGTIQFIVGHGDATP